MNAIFVIKGRLGNAIFRYLGCTIFAIKYNLKYSPIGIRSFGVSITDDIFNQFIKFDKLNKYPPLYDNITNYKFDGYYQHDDIYKKYKTEITEYINKYKNEHYVITDGINAGDGKYEKFYLKDIVNTPENFNKYYDFVLHIRLGDRVNNDLHSGTTLSIKGIKNLVKKISIPSNSCIVVNTPKSKYEKKFLSEVIEYINYTNKIEIKVESNDVITDFHIMKNSKTLVCSISTLSWCAAYFSKKIQKCYMPDYPKRVNEFGYCKKPIDNTELYDWHGETESKKS
tara:strand:+ start:3787 stop:4635 length:849 start_codon:yes stop_codon:yes gene_type:complete